MNTQEQDFSGKLILVSGASSGIGRAIAIRLVQIGARVALIGRRKEKLEETALLSSAPDRTELCVLDLANLEEIGPAIDELFGRVGRMYGLCHCAGIVKTLPLLASTSERIRAMFDVNFLAGLELARAITRRDVMAESGGCILWIASTYAHAGAPGQIGYCASKGAITAAMRSMALELASRKVRVNCISPGMVRSEMTEAAGSRLSKEQWAHIASLHPLGVGEPQDVARAAVFMLDPNNKWMTGTDLIIDGGYLLQ